MKDKTKIKLLISLSILIVAILLTVVVIQIVDITKTKKDHEITLVVLVSEPSELNKVTSKRVRWKEPAAGRGASSPLPVKMCSLHLFEFVGQALDLLVLSS